MGPKSRVLCNKIRDRFFENLFRKQKIRQLEKSTNDVAVKMYFISAWLFYFHSKISEKIGRDKAA